LTALNSGRFEANTVRGHGAAGVAQRSSPSPQKQETRLLIPLDLILLTVLAETFGKNFWAENVF
jgi:hypothetical protein